jgi:hypothetical protein
MKLLCKKSIKLSPFDEIFKDEIYEVNTGIDRDPVVFAQWTSLHETIFISGKGMSGPSWFEIDPPSGRHDTRLENYFYSQEETRNITLNKLLNK